MDYHKELVFRGAMTITEREREKERERERESNSAIGLVYYYKNYGPIYVLWWTELCWLHSIPEQSTSKALKFVHTVDKKNFQTKRSLINMHALYWDSSHTPPVISYLFVWYTFLSMTT